MMENATTGSPVILRFWNFSRVVELWFVQVHALIGWPVWWVVSFVIFPPSVSQCAIRAFLFVLNRVISSDSLAVHKVLMILYASGVCREQSSKRVLIPPASRTFLSHLWNPRFYRIVCGNSWYRPTCSQMAVRSSWPHYHEKINILNVLTNPFGGNGLAFSKSRSNTYVSLSIFIQ